MYRTYLDSADIYREDKDGSLIDYQTQEINQHVKADSIKELLEKVAEVLFSKKKDLSAFQFSGFETDKDGKNNAIILADYGVRGHLNYSPEEIKSFRLKDFNPASTQFTVEKYEHIDIPEDEFDFLGIE